MVYVKPAPGRDCLLRFGWQWAGGLISSAEPNLCFRSDLAEEGLKKGVLYNQGFKQQN